MKKERCLEKQELMRMRQQLLEMPHDKMELLELLDRLHCCMARLRHKQHEQLQKQKQLKLELKR